MTSLSDSQLEHIADGEDPTRVLLTAAMKEPRSSSAFARSTPVAPSWLEYQERGLACDVLELPARVGARVLLLRGACLCRCKVYCGRSVESAKRGGENVRLAFGVLFILILVGVVGELVRLLS